MWHNHSSSEGEESSEDDLGAMPERRKKTQESVRLRRQSRRSSIVQRRASIKVGAKASMRRSSINRRDGKVRAERTIYGRSANQRRRPKVVMDSQNLASELQSISDRDSDSGSSNDDDVSKGRGSSFRRGLQRLPQILRGRNSATTKKVSSRSSIYEETVYTRRLVDEMEAEEREKQEKEKLKKAKQIMRDAAGSIDDLGMVNGRLHLNTARWRTLTSSLRHGRGFPNMSNPTRIEVTEVFLSDKYSAEGAQHLSEIFLASKVGLKRLEFKGCYFDPDSVTTIMEAIMGNANILNNLETLRFDGNCIGDSGAKAIAKWLRESQVVVELGLVNAGLTDKGALKIADALDLNESLDTFECMELSNKDNLSDDTLDELLDVLDSVGGTLKIAKTKNNNMKNSSKKKKKKRSAAI